MNVLEALDDGIAALTWLRQQVAAGRVDPDALQSLMDSGLLDHELLREARESQAQQGRSDSGAPADEDTSSEGETAACEGSADPDEADPAEPTSLAEPPSPHHEAEELVARLAALPGALKKLGVHVPAAAAQFCKNASRAPQSLPDDEKKGERLASLLFNAVGVLDSVQKELIWSGRTGGLKSALDGLRGPLAAFLERDHGLVFVPSVDLNRIDPADPPASASIDWVAAPQPPGTVLAVVSRAFRRDGTAGGQSRLIVARGEPGELRSRLFGIWPKVEADPAGDPAADLAKLSRWIHELDDDDEAMLTSTSRHVLNLIHDRNGAGAYGADVKWLMAFLGRSGITELTARIGRRFDESYSPSKYERHLVYSDQPAGTIVRIVRLGLLDSGGIPLQKAVLGVSRGND